MTTLNYISDIPLKKASGGGSGINNATYKELKNHFQVNVFPAINPSADRIRKIRSKLLRVSGFEGNYHHYSETRLKEIRSEFNRYDQEADAYFFHGFTPWIKIKPQKPYYCFNDACFATYVEIYNNKNEFLHKDLKRIFDQEAEWLNSARKVFFRSDWARRETMKHYHMKGQNFEVVGVGGFIPVPTEDRYQEGYNFLFISREFTPKGGLTAVEAFQQVREVVPQANLWIVGDKPEEDVLNTKGVIYKGFFDKKVEKERQALEEIFSKAFALIHPTLKDTNTLVITELAYYGCPAISSNDFAIPEYLLNKETGLLLNNPRDVQEVTEKMLLLIENPKLYKQMRINARENAIANNTWKKVGKRIATMIAETS